MNMPKPADNPVTADQRVAHAVEAVVPNPADRAAVLVVVAMAVKSHRLEARRIALAENAELQWERDIARMAGEVERELYGVGKRAEVMA